MQHKEQVFPWRRVLILMAVLCIGASLPKGSVAQTGFEIGVDKEESEELFRWAIAAEVDQLDPHAATSRSVQHVLRQIYEPLLEVDAQGNLYPVLATQWEVVEGDARRWRFTLRRGVFFHSGAELHADDVVFSLLRAVRVGDFGFVAGDIRDVRAVSEDVVEIVTSMPHVTLPYHLTEIMIVDLQWVHEIIAGKSALVYSRFRSIDVNSVIADAAGDYWTRSPNGTGAYAMQRPELDQSSVVLRRFDRYWGQGRFPLRMDEVRILPIPSVSARINALLSRRVDLVTDLPPTLSITLKNSPFVKILEARENRILFLGIRVTADYRSNNVGLKGSRPLTDIRVRRAVDMAINRYELQRLLFNGRSTLTGTLVPSESFGYNPDLSGPTVPDAAGARSLLHRLGYKEGFSVRMACPSGRYSKDRELCRRLVSMLGDVGVLVTLTYHDAGQYLLSLEREPPDMFLLGWAEKSYQSDHALWQLATSRGEWNLVGYRDFNLEDRLLEAMQNFSLESRQADVQELWNEIQREYLYLPLYRPWLRWATLRRFDVPINSQDRLYVKNIAIAR